MEMPKPGEAHARLHDAGRTWQAEKTLHPAPWDPAGGSATAFVKNRVALGGFAVVQEYEQTATAAPNFSGHGLFWWDGAANQYVMTWFDSMMGTPAEYRGAFDGDVLRLTHAMPQRRFLALSRSMRALPGSTCSSWRCRRTAQAWAPAIEGAYGCCMARRRARATAPARAAKAGRSRRRRPRRRRPRGREGAARQARARRRALPDRERAAAARAAAKRRGRGWPRRKPRAARSGRRRSDEFRANDPGARAGGIALGVAATLGAQTAQSGTRREPQFENAHVRVWKSIIMPKQPLSMHRHEQPRALIALKGGHHRHRAEERRVGAAPVGDRARPTGSTEDKPGTTARRREQRHRADRGDRRRAAARTVTTAAPGASHQRGGADPAGVRPL